MTAIRSLFDCYSIADRERESNLTATEKQQHPETAYFRDWSASDMPLPSSECLSKRIPTSKYLRCRIIYDTGRPSVLQFLRFAHSQWIVDQELTHRVEPPPGKRGLHMVR
ncbi:hypothetical protein Y032_0208g2059 [Ancylostoma ceylanicum]|uniref:Uncharacterized protein n=1 Tax=Ancylostoma ceylanicum TaxID=53326 RepID=A0A016SKJ6_9BILA|nr:hypothetical protein Y032_0208g2059 [Ancylostoma ceylanicum]